MIKLFILTVFLFSCEQEIEDKQTDPLVNIKGPKFETYRKVPLSSLPPKVSGGVIGVKDDTLVLNRGSMHGLTKAPL